MAVRKISEEQFYKYKVLKSPMASSLGTEEIWYEEKDNNLIATIINDMFDKDWSFVILAKNENNEYTAIDLGVSIKEQNEAEKQVVAKLNELSKTGEFREELYSEDNKTEKTEQSIIITDINEEVKKYLKKHPEKLYELTSRKFEELVASILVDMGLTVQITQATRDGGSDIIAQIKNSLTSFLILVECKRYAPDNKVSVEIVRQVAGVHMLREPAKSIIVTTSTFTKPAHEVANELKGKVELKDYENLKQWLQQY